MQNNTGNQVHAGFFVRLIAYLVDQLLVGIGLLFLQIPLSILQIFLPNNLFVKDLIFQYSIADIVCYAIGVAYFVLFTYHRGATLGKMLLHIRVVSTEERKLTFLEVLYRETIGRFLSGLILSVGYWFVIFHKEKRGLHDLLSDTKVVYYFTKTVTVEVPVTVQQVKKPVILTNSVANGYNPPGYNSTSYMAASYMPVPEEPVVKEPEVELEIVVEEAATEESISDTEIEK